MEKWKSEPWPLFLSSHDPESFVHSRMDGCVCAPTCVFVCCRQCGVSLRESCVWREFIFYFVAHIPACALCLSVWLRGGRSGSWVISWENWRRDWPIGVRLGCRCGRCQAGFLGFQSNFPSIVVQTGCEWMAMEVWLLVMWNLLHLRR